MLLSHWLAGCCLRNSSFLRLSTSYSGTLTPPCAAAMLPSHSLLPRPAATITTAKAATAVAAATHAAHDEYAVGSKDASRV